jgi:glycosyltransferase involved in cell wall biosynthesis
MKVSLIIPTYNRAHLIGETLGSLLNQSYTNWECIVVDDGSEDNTEEVVNSFMKMDSRFSFYKRPANRKKGANACRNFGFLKSSGQLINWLDSDDLLTKDHFEIHAEKHRDLTLDCVVSKAKNFVNDPEEENGMWSETRPVNEAWKDLIAGRISWATPSVTWKRKSLPTDPFDERLQSSQEWFFHIGRLLDGVKYCLIEKDTIRVRRHDNRIGTSINPSKFKSRFLSRINIFKSLKKSGKLTKEEEYFLIKQMLKSLYKSSQKKISHNTLYMTVEMIRLLFHTSYWAKILKPVFIGVPICFITGRGEILFKLAK